MGLEIRPRFKNGPPTIPRHSDMKNCNDVHTVIHDSNATASASLSFVLTGIFLRGLEDGDGIVGEVVKDDKSPVLVDGPCGV